MSLLPLSSSWSDLSWEQLCTAWDVKQRYAGNADVARVAALLSLLGLDVEGNATISEQTGESVYHLRDSHGNILDATPRELAFIAKKALAWFDYPYGDQGEKEQRDEKGKIIKERREPVQGYVSSMQDALILPKDKLTVCKKSFALPLAACNNLTWQQYRALQSITPSLFSDDVTDEQTLTLQAEFLSNILIPRSLALLDTTGGSIRFRPHYEYKYNAEQAESLVPWFKKQLVAESKVQGSKGNNPLSTLFHICFQTYQTAVTYYAATYPLLFEDSGNNDKLRDALAGEVGTVNTIMKYAGYAEQQQVYDSNLPFVLDILNTMTREAKEIKRMNSKIKKKK